jgi:hypothetical protein
MGHGDDLSCRLARRAGIAAAMQRHEQFSQHERRADGSDDALLDLAQQLTSRCRMAWIVVEKEMKATVSR